MAPELTVAAVGGQAVFDSIPVAPGKGPLVLSFSASSGADPSASFPAPTLAGGVLLVWLGAEAAVRRLPCKGAFWGGLHNVRSAPKSPKAVLKKPNFFG